MKKILLSTFALFFAVSAFADRWQNNTFTYCDDQSGHSVITCPAPRSWAIDIFQSDMQSHIGEYLESVDLYVAASDDYRLQIYQNNMEINKNGPLELVYDHVHHVDVDGEGWVSLRLAETVEIWGGEMRVVFTSYGDGYPTMDNRSGAYYHAHLFRQNENDSWQAYSQDGSWLIKLHKTNTLPEPGVLSTGNWNAVKFVNDGEDDNGMPLNHSNFLSFDMQHINNPTLTTASPDREIMDEHTQVVCVTEGEESFSGNRYLFTLMAGIDMTEGEVYYYLWKTRFVDGHPDMSDSYILSRWDALEFNATGMTYDPYSDSILLTGNRYDATTGSYSNALYACAHNGEGPRALAYVASYSYNGYSPMILSLASVDGKLYGISDADEHGSKMYKIGSDGQCSLVGPTNFNLYNASGLLSLGYDSDSRELFCLRLEDNTQYDDEWEPVGDYDYESVLYKMSEGRAYRIGSLGRSSNTVYISLYYGSKFAANNSLLQPDAAISVTAYPNPASDMLSVDAEANITMLQLFSLKGSLVRIEGGLSGSSASLDIHEVPTGVYLLRVTTDQGAKTIRIVKE